MTKYTDFDYNSIPIPDLDLDQHWIQLPKAVLLEKRKAREAALLAERIVAQPEDHQIILVPADPTYSPRQEELWPIVNHAVLGVLQRHHEAHAEVVKAVYAAIDEYRGWRNPYPVSTDYPDRPVKTKTRRVN